MRISLGALKSVLQNNVAEIKFTRRKVKPGSPPTRRMLCTNNVPLLNSIEGRTVLNYVPPTQAPKYNPNQENLIITWDIFMQGFRTINVDQCDLVTLIPANDTFWEYFRDNLWDMRQGDKTNFIDS